MLSWRIWFPLWFNSFQHLYLDIASIFQFSGNAYCIQWNRRILICGKYHTWRFTLWKIWYIGLVEEASLVVVVNGDIYLSCKHVVRSCCKCWELYFIENLEGYSIQMELLMLLCCSLMLKLIYYTSVVIKFRLVFEQESAIFQWPRLDDFTQVKLWFSR